MIGRLLHRINIKYRVTLAAAPGRPRPPAGRRTSPRRRLPRRGLAIGAPAADRAASAPHLGPGLRRSAAVRMFEDLIRTIALEGTGCRRRESVFTEIDGAVFRLSDGRCVAPGRSARAVRAWAEAKRRFTCRACGPEPRDAAAPRSLPIPGHPRCPTTCSTAATSPAPSTVTGRIRTIASLPFALRTDAPQVGTAGCRAPRADASTVRVGYGASMGFGKRERIKRRRSA